MRRQRVKRAVVVRVMQVGVMRKRGPVRLMLSLCPVRRAMRPLMREGRPGLWSHAHEHNSNGEDCYRGSFQVHRHIHTPLYASIFSTRASVTA